MSDQEVNGILAGFSSVHNGENRLFDLDVPVFERRWSSASRRPQVAELLFDGVYEITRIELLEVGSDQTSVKVEWGIYLRNPDGGYTADPIVGDKGVNVVRGANGAMGFSIDNDAIRWPIKKGWKSQRKVRRAIDYRLPTYHTAMAGQLRISGHGWFSAVGLTFSGRRVCDEITPLQALTEDYAADLRLFYPDGRPLNG